MYKKKPGLYPHKMHTLYVKIIYNFRLSKFENMDSKICANYEVCRLVAAEDYEIDLAEKNDYIEKFCTAGVNKWTSCKRYITKSELNFCPDFVLPDTALSPKEIIDKFDEDDSLR